MTATAIRQLLHEYIRFADEKKVKAIYTMVEEEVNTQHDIWTKEFAKLMQRRAKDITSGKVKGKTWEEVLRRAELLLPKKK